VAQFVRVPVEQLSPEALGGLLEEFASRDGTDYGEREVALGAKRESLLRQLAEGSIVLLFDLDSEQWDIVDAHAASDFLGSEE